MYYSDWVKPLCMTHADIVDVLERILTEVVPPTTADFSEMDFATLRKVTDRLNPTEFLRESRLS